MRTEWAESVNGGRPLLATWLPHERDGEGGWRVEGRTELISREHFFGNYRIIKDNRARVQGAQ